MRWRARAGHIRRETPHYPYAREAKGGLTWASIWEGADPDLARAALEVAQSDVEARYAYLAKLAEERGKTDRTNIVDVNKSACQEAAAVKWSSSRIHSPQTLQPSKGYRKSSSFARNDEFPMVRPDKKAVRTHNFEPVFDERGGNKSTTDVCRRH
jgi:hypothetical protein